MNLKFLKLENYPDTYFSLQFHKGGSHTVSAYLALAVVEDDKWYEWYNDFVYSIQ